MKLLFTAALLISCAAGINAQDTDSEPTGHTAAQAKLFLQTVAAQFPQWDLNHDGILSTEELETAATNTATVNQAAAAVAALTEATHNKLLPLPPLSLTNISTLVAERHPDLAAMFAESLHRIQGATNRELFAVGQPRLDTIHQGRLGNCFCLAPLGAMVHRDPQAVAAMFSPETNGDFLVKIGGQNIEVAPPTDAEIAMSSSNEHEGIWVNIYEKAVGTLRNEQRPADKRVDSPLEALAKGGSAGTMLGVITGHGITRFSFKFAKDATLPPTEFSNKLVALRQQLTAAANHKILMTCGTLRVTTPGLHPMHAYAVLNYQPATDMVELWNPHGQNFSPKAAPPGPTHGYPTKNGVFDIPVPDFVKLFSGMAFEVPGETPRT